MRTLICLFISLLASWPGVGWPACEPPYHHTALAAGWCAGIGGYADADYNTPGQANELVMVERAFSGALALPPGSDNFFLGLDLSYRSYEADEEIGANLDLYQLTARPQWRFDGDTRDWLLHLAVTRAVSSNRMREADWHGDEMFYSAAAVARQPLGQRRTLVFGAAYDYAFGGPKLYPTAGIEMPLNARWQAGLILPAPYVEWHGAGDWSARFGLRPTGARWRVLDGDTGRDFDTAVRAIRFSAVLRWRFHRRWQLAATLAAGFNRSLATSASDGSRISAGLDPAPFGAIALYYD